MKSVRVGIREIILKNKKLSERDIDILQMAADGFYGADISDKWHISENTIRKNRHRIYDTLGADNLTHAIAVAMRQGLIT